MAGAQYYRGFLLEANTNNTTMAFQVRDADGNNLHAFTGPAGSNNITHAGQTQIEYTFTTPFVAHLCRYEPGNAANNNAVDWQFFGIKWVADPWPELSTDRSSWMNLGTPGAKYVTSVVLPIDTANNNANFNFVTSDGITRSAGPFLTAPSNKTPQPMAFTSPLIFHEVQIAPQNNTRMWPEEAQWNFEPWPEVLRESSMWFDMGTPRAKYVRGFTVPVDTDGNNMSFTMGVDGGSTSAVFGNVNTAAGVKTPASFAVGPLVTHEAQLTPSVPARVWWKEAQWDFEVWPEIITESTAWMNLGTPGAKYMRGVVIPVETGGVSVTLSLISSDGGSVTMGTVQTSALVKTPTPFAFSIPLIGHEYRIVPSAPCRIWTEEARWDFDPWPELITEATGWLPVLPGNAAAFLQGLLLPVEAAGVAIQLSLLTDTSPTAIPLIPTRTPLANVKTPIPYALSTPVVCHQVQIVPSAACRVWLPEIQWIAEQTPELATTWTTQATAHGGSGYQSVLRIEASYSSTATAFLSLTAFDGTSPATITLPNTGGAKQKVLLTPTFNKGQLYTYSAISLGAFQIFGAEWIVWVGVWGRKGSARAYRLLGGAFDDKAVI